MLNRPLLDSIFLKGTGKIEIQLGRLKKILRSERQSKTDLGSSFEKVHLERNLIPLHKYCPGKKTSDRKVCVMLQDYDNQELNPKQNQFQLKNRDHCLIMGNKLITGEKNKSYMQKLSILHL